MLYGVDPKEIVQVKPVIFAPGEVGGLVSYWKGDKNGNRITPIYVHKSESFLLQFLQILAAQFYGSPISPNSDVAFELVKDTAGSSSWVSNCLRNFYAAGAIGDTTLGIVAGTDNTAPVFTDNALIAEIAHGTGAGQLQYGVTGWGTPSSDAAEAHFRISRVLSNSSGGLIHVDEIGIKCAFWKEGLESDHGYPPLATAAKRALIVRDLLGVGGEDIANGQTLTINYDIKAVV